MIGSGSGFGAILGSPYYLVTIIFGAFGWLIQFAAMCAAEAQKPSTVSGAICGTLWFSVWVQLIVTVTLIIACMQDTVHLHRLQFALFTAIALVFNIIGVNAFIYANVGSYLAVGVGSLILAMVDIVWLLYLTSDEESYINYVLSGGINGVSGWGSGGGGGRRRSRGAPQHHEAGVYASESSGLRHAGAERGMSSHELPSNGGYPMGGYGSGTMNLDTAPSQKTAPVSTSRDDFSAVGQSVDNVTFKHRARANYAYTASPDDPNEVSFAKGDILEVVDNTGKWFQVRTPAGQMGIAPSNYLTLL